MMSLASMLILFTGAIANAEAVFDSESQRGLVYFMQGDNVNASVCYEVDEKQLRNVHTILKTDKCQNLSEAGLSRNDADRVVENLKEEVQKIEPGIVSPFGALVGSVDKEAGNIVNDFFGGFIERQRQAILELTGEQLFRTLVVGAKTPTVRRANKSEDLDREIAEFVQMVTK